jgi:hypothetical protein
MELNASGDRKQTVESGGLQLVHEALFKENVECEESDCRVGRSPIQVGPTDPEKVLFANALRTERGKKKTKLHGLSPRANYTDRATAACRRSDC